MFLFTILLAKSFQFQLNKLLSNKHFRLRISTFSLVKRNHFSVELKCKFFIWVSLRVQVKSPCPRNPNFYGYVSLSSSWIAKGEKRGADCLCVVILRKKRQYNELYWAIHFPGLRFFFFFLTYSMLLILQIELFLT